MAASSSRSRKKLLLIAAAGVALAVGVAAFVIAFYADAEDRSIEKTAHDVLARAQDSSEIMGVSFTLKSLSASACSGSLGEIGDTEYSVRGGFHFKIDKGEIVNYVEKAHETWKKRGWNITDFRRVSDGIVLVADDPETGFQFRMDGFSDDGFVNAPIYSPCFDDPSWQEAKDLYEIVDVPKPSKSESEPD